MASIVACINNESSTEVLLVFGAVFVVTYLLYRRQNVSYSGRKLPPAMPSLPLVGSLPFLPTSLKDLADLCINPRNKLGKIFSLRFGPKYAVIISGQRALREALIIKSVSFADRVDLYSSLFIPQRTKGILNACYDAKFRSRHQLCLSIMKRFGFGQPRVMEARILREVKEMINKVREEQGRPFDVKQLTTTCVANVIMHMMFGRRFDSSDPEFKSLIYEFSRFLSSFSVIIEMFPALRFLPPLKKKFSDFIASAKNIISFVDNIIAACIQKQTESFVNYYIEAEGPDYDREQLIGTAIDLAGGGTDLTTTFMCWAVAVLTNHISVQERLQAEIDSVIGRQRLPTLDDRSKLPYVEATILELFRYKTVVPVIMHCTLKDTEVGGYFVPKGTMVLVNLYSAHMDPEDWQQPEQFRPERFLDQAGNVINAVRDQVIPFSLGKRSCFGEQLARQEIFLLLVSLLQNFYFKPPEGQDSINVREEWGGTMVPSDYEVRMVARNDA